MKKIREYSHQCVVFEWALYHRRQYPELKWLNSSMNGISLTKRQAARAKRAGLIAGIPDIDLPVNRGPYGGLRIELKTKGGRLTRDQEDCLNFMIGQGYRAVACYGADDAIETIIQYLEMSHA